MKKVHSGFKQYEGSNWVLVPEEELTAQAKELAAANAVIEDCEKLMLQADKADGPMYGYECFEYIDKARTLLSDYMEHKLREAGVKGE